MNQLLEWMPLLAFFIVFKLYGIYWATGVLMVACVLQLVTHRIRTGQFKTVQVITTSVVLVLGTATLLLHDKRFIQWKPTALLSLAALAFLGSTFIGAKPLARRMLESLFKEHLDIGSRAWSAINLMWVVWLLLLAGLNLYVARNFAESVWVNFKVFGISIAMMIFMLPQVLWLSAKAEPHDAG